MGALAAGGLGFGSAGGAAGSSIGWGEASTALNVGGDLFAGIGQSQQAGYAAAVASNNAAIMRQNAGATLQAGAYEEASSKLHTGEVIGQERAAQGANNIDVSVGSAPQVRQSTATVGAMDAAMIHYNAARAAYGQEVEATSLEAQSKLDKMAGTNAIVGSLFKAGSSLLSGASSVGSKYAGYQLSGAL